MEKKQKTDAADAADQEDDGDAEEVDESEVEIKKKPSTKTSAAAQMKRPAAAPGSSGFQP